MKSDLGLDTYLISAKASFNLPHREGITVTDEGVYLRLTGLPMLMINRLLAPV